MRIMTDYLNLSSQIEFGFESPLASTLQQLVYFCSPESFIF